MTIAKIYLLCGDSGSGKTTTLIRLLEWLTTSTLTVRGILCPPVIGDGVKTGIDLYDVITRKSHRLAELNETGETSLATRRWKMNPEVLHIGNRILKNAIPCDILFVDELGPLEFERNEGLLEGFAAIASRAYQLAFVTIRPSLLEKALQRWPDAVVIQINRPHQDSLINQLKELVNNLHLSL